MRRNRLVAMGLLVVGTLIGVPAVQAQPAPEPFTCSNDLFFLYQSGSEDVVSHVARLDRTGVSVSFADLGSPIPGALNALAYNPGDDFLYAMDDISGRAADPGSLFRIASDGSAQNLGVPVGLDLNVGGFIAATFLAPDTYVVGASTYDGTTTLVFIDVPTNTVQKTLALDAAFADFATNPLDGRLYGCDFFSGQLAWVDTTTGATTRFGSSLGENLVTMGSAWFLNSGQMSLYGMPLAGGGGQDRFYDADAGTNGNGSGAFTELGTGPVASGTDGASCVVLATPTTSTTTTSVTVTTGATNPPPTQPRAVAAVVTKATFTG